MHFVTRGQGNLSWRLVSFQWDWSQMSATLIIKKIVSTECKCTEIVFRMLSFDILRTELSFYLFITDISLSAEPRYKVA